MGLVSKRQLRTEQAWTISRTGLTFRGLSNALDAIEGGIRASRSPSHAAKAYSEIFSAS